MLYAVKESKSAANNEWISAVIAIYKIICYYIFTRCLLTILQKISLVYRVRGNGKEEHV
jgi:hypothetical protein